MAEKNVQAVIKLRRDSQKNFERSNIVLQNGEIALVTTPFHGTQVKIGDGSKRFSDLKYDTFGLLARGFVSSDELRFKDTNLDDIDPNEHLLFLDLNTGFLYYWDSVHEKFQYIRHDEVILYDTVDGQNTDGSVTQRALNSALNKIQRAAKNVVFEMDSEDSEQLNADLSSLGALQIFD